MRVPTFTFLAAPLEMRPMDEGTLGSSGKLSPIFAVFCVDRLADGMFALAGAAVQARVRTGSGGGEID